MNKILEEMQKQTLERVHKMKCDTEMQLGVWRPERKDLDYLLSVEGFEFHTYKDDSQILTLISHERPKNLYFPLMTINIFCKHEDAEHLQTKLKQRKEVSK